MEQIQNLFNFYSTILKITTIYDLSKDSKILYAL